MKVLRAFAVSVALPLVLTACGGGNDYTSKINPDRAADLTYMGFKDPRPMSVAAPKWYDGNDDGQGVYLARVDMPGIGNCWVKLSYGNSHGRPLDWRFSTTGRVYTLRSKGDVIKALEAPDVCTTDH